MNLKSVFLELAEALNNDTDIAAFMQETYGESTIGRINIGIDSEEYPDVNETTAIYMLPGSRSRTRGDAYRQHNISIICLVNVNTVNSESGISENNIDKIEALGTLDDFTNLVEKCVFEKLQSLKLAITPLSGESDELYYPIACSELAYSVEIPSRI